MVRKAFRNVSDASSTISLVTLSRNSSTTYNPGPASPNTTIPSTPVSPTTPITPTSNITPPASAPNLRRISELVDPRDLFDTPFTDKHYQATERGTPSHSRRYTGSSPTLPPQQSRILAESPSGKNFLNAEEYLAQANRALSMRERREIIATNTRVKVESRVEMRLEATFEERTESQGRIRKRSRHCWFCWY